MKVVYNRCYGGFSLSYEGICRLSELKGIKAPSKNDVGSYHLEDIERDDVDLVRVVEELEHRANGAHADLAIRDVPIGERWRIDEYDGNECVMTVSDYDWKVAR